MFKDGFYPVRGCSICGARIGYEVHNGKPYFNSSCDCSSYPRRLQPRDDEEFREFLDTTNGDV